MKDVVISEGDLSAGMQGMEALLKTDSVLIDCPFIWFDVPWGSDSWCIETVISAMLAHEETHLLLYRMSKSEDLARKLDNLRYPFEKEGEYVLSEDPSGFSYNFLKAELGEG